MTTPTVRADRGERQVAHVDAGQPDGAGVDVVQPRHERRQRRLAGAGRADEGDASGPARRGTRRRAAPRRRRGRRARRPPPATPATPGRPAGRRTTRRRARPTPVRRARRGRRRLGDERLDVEHLEDPLEADQRRHDVEARRAERGQRPVQPVEQQGHRDDGAGVEAAAAGRGSRRGRRSAPGRGRTRASASGRTPPSPSPSGRRCRAPARPAAPNSAASSSGPAEQLDQRRARRREALGHLRRHRRVVHRRLPVGGGRPEHRSGGPGSRTAAAGRGRAA